MHRKDKPEVSVTFRRYRRDPRTGRILDAHDYGYKAWPMRFKKKK